MSQKLMSFRWCIFSNDDCKAAHFFRFFIIFKHVVCFYFKNENNECVVSMKMIMRRIKVKSFISKNVVCNDVDHEIKHVTHISKIHIHVFCKRVDVDVHSIVNQNKKWFHFWHQHEFVCTISFFDKMLLHCFVDDVSVEVMIQNSWRAKKIIENEVDCEKFNDTACLYDDKNFYWFLLLLFIFVFVFIFLTFFIFSFDAFFYRFSLHWIL